MSKEFNQKLELFRNYIKIMSYYNNVLSLLQWDLRTGAPGKGVPARAAIIGHFSTEAFRMSTSDTMEDYLNYFSSTANHNRLDEVMKAVIRECKRDFDRNNKIPEELYREYSVLVSEAGSVWEKAKNTADFSLFSPYLEKIIDFNIKFTDYLEYEGNRYNALLDMYEPGMTVDKLDQIFSRLRKNLVPLVAEVTESGNEPDDAVLKKFYSPKKQDDLSRELLEEIGYDFEAGRLDESEHPFTTGINPGDVRLTTHYYPHDLKSALFSSLHEGGHGLYEQNISSDLTDTPLYTGVSMGIHESQSRFWENIIGRSRNFWVYNYNRIQKLFPDELAKTDLEEFYRGINKVEPSLIRIEADELTYNLHIMVRYEIEKGLINKEIAVEQLPAIWNSKMKEYLGIEPGNDREGVLQDVHWSGGMFGYFPSYALGNIYSAQICQAIKKEISDFDGLVSRGEFLKIKEWLTENIYQYGKIYDPAEIMQKVTGEDINSDYLIEYLDKKYSEIYQL